MESPELSTILGFNAPFNLFISPGHMLSEIINSFPFALLENVSIKAYNFKVSCPCPN